MSIRSRSPHERRNVKFAPQRDVEHLIQVNQASIWPCKLPNQHRQLKNYISTVTKDIIYYVSENKVFAIHIPTRRQQLLAALPFKPMCIASGHGWVCLGGFHHGTCAFLDFHQASPFESTAETWVAQVDDLLPLDLDPHSRVLSDGQSIYDEISPRRRHKIILKSIGTEIVNGITISKLPGDGENTTDDVVAVLANNDKTITIYSLTRGMILKTLSQAVHINHATISPDGKLLVAVGDINKVWFYRKVLRRRASSQTCYDWDEVATIRLVCTIRNDWCFSTAWSPSGHLCVVASQFGTITVFETSKIREDMDHTDAVLHFINSSRPTVTEPTSLIPSAPRSMAFCPGPWDLLAWAEDHGRITVIDLRDDFTSRQTIHVDIDAKNLQRETYVTTSQSNLASTGQGLRRIRQRGSGALYDDAEFVSTDAIDYGRSAAGASLARASGSDRGGGQLQSTSAMSDSERELLELLGIEQARDSTEAQFFGPYSILHTDLSSSNDSASALPLSFGRYTINRSENRSNPASWTTPRRRNSVVIQSSSASRTSAAHPSSLIPGPSVPLSASPSRLSDLGALDTDLPGHDTYQQSEQAEPSNTRLETNFPTLDEQRSRQRFISNSILRYSHLRDIERERASEIAARWRTFMPVTSTNTQNSESRELAESERYYREQARTWGRRINELRERAIHLRDAHGGSAGGSASPNLEDTVSPTDIANDIMLGAETISRARSALARYNSTDEIDIQGLGWSWDGRYLFVGTSDGIMQYSVNVRGRMASSRLHFT